MPEINERFTSRQLDHPDDGGVQHQLYWMLEFLQTAIETVDPRTNKPWWWIADRSAERSRVLLFCRHSFTATFDDLVGQVEYSLHPAGNSTEALLGKAPRTALRGGSMYAVYDRNEPIGWTFAQHQQDLLDLLNAADLRIAT